MTSGFWRSTKEAEEGGVRKAVKKRGSGRREKREQTNGIIK